jgi:hypothetical protein
MPSFRQLFLPYALMRLSDGWFLPVNRRYKPLGQSGGVFVDYGAHYAKVRIKGLTEARAEHIGLKVGGNAYYLYDDGTNPQASAANWSRYEAILSKLMKMEVDHADGGRLPGRVGRRRLRFLLR